MTEKQIQKPPLVLAKKMLAMGLVEKVNIKKAKKGDK